MAMSKKDYQAIARAIYEAFGQKGEYGSHGESLRLRTMVRMSIALSENPRFDRARFIEACETGSCEGMPKR